jgi:hypothetical protein
MEILIHLVMFIVLYMGILMLFVIEMLSAVRFGFNEKMITKIGVLTIIKRMFESNN